MKRGIALLSLVVVPVLSDMGFAQTADNLLSPAFCYTSGSYSNDIQSRATDYYTAYVFRAGDYIDAGYEMVQLEQSLWEYNQSLAYAGGGINYYPYYFQFHYARLGGKYDRKDYVYSYNDNGNIYNLFSYYNWDLFYFGFSYTFLEISGYKNIISHQAGFRFYWLISPSVILSTEPLYSQMSDGRTLYSLTAKGSLYLSSEFLLQILVSFGERAYYFHPDLLTLYNQDDTQRTVLGLRGEVQLSKQITLIASYQNVNFVGYTIQYVTIGAKGTLPF